MHNAFNMVRPRGADAPAKVPTKPKKAPVPITVRGTTRVMNSRGHWQAKLAPSHHSIVVESREQAQASTDKTRRISRSGVQ